MISRVSKLLVFILCSLPVLFFFQNCGNFESSLTKNSEVSSEQEAIDDFSGVMAATTYRNTSDYTNGWGRTLYIPSGTDVTINNNINFNRIVIAGTLRCRMSDSNSTQRIISTRDITIQNGGKFICGSNWSNPYPGKLDIRLYEGYNAHNEGPRAFRVLSGGELRLHGRSNKSQFQRLRRDIDKNRTAPAGAPSNRYSHRVYMYNSVNWDAGDDIVVSSTSWDYRHNEKKTLSSSDHTGAEVSSTTQFHKFHKGGLMDVHGTDLDERAYVANLNRYIKIRAYGGTHTTSKIGGHLMIKMGGRAYIDSVEFYAMGQLGTLARYPVHWHHGMDAGGQYIRRSSIHNSYQRCIVIHKTDNVEVSRNTCYDINGHGIFLEEGVERGNNIFGNLVMRTKPLDRADALLVSESRELNGDGEPVSTRFPGPAAYWIANPDNIVHSNAAVGNQGTGFWMAFDKHRKCFRGSCYRPVNVRTRNFNHNRAMSNRVGITWDGSPSGPVIDPNDENRPRDRKLQSTHYSPRSNWDDPNSAPVKPTFSGLNVVKNREAGLYFRGDPATFTNSIFADNRWSVFLAYSQEVKNSVIIGHSPNLRYGDSSYRDDYPHRIGTNNGFGGVVVYDGPFHLDSVDFKAFPTTRQVNGKPEQYTMVPFFNIAGQKKWVNTVQDVSFTPTPYRKVRYRAVQSWLDVESTLAVKDLDGSLTGSAGNVVVYKDDFNDNGDCDTFGDSNAMKCNYNISTYEIDDYTDPNNLKTFFNVKHPSNGHYAPYRDENHPDSSKRVPESKQVHNKFNAIEGHPGGYYTIEPEDGSRFKNNRRFTIRVTSRGQSSQQPRVYIKGKKNCVAEGNTAGLTRFYSWTSYKNHNGSGYISQAGGLHIKMKGRWIHKLHPGTNIYENSYRFLCDP